MASAPCGCFSHFSTGIIRFFLLRSIFFVNETRAASGSRNPASDFGHLPVYWSRGESLFTYSILMAQILSIITVSATDIRFMLHTLS